MKYKLILDPSREEEVVVTAHRPSALTERIEELIRQDAGEDRIVGYREGEMELLTVSDIECVTVIDGKTFAIDGKNRQYRLKQRLYELEEILPSCFIRINKSTLANKTRLVRFTASFSGAVDAVFRCGYKEYVSRRCFADIKRRFTEK